MAVGKTYKEMLAGGQRFAALYHIAGQDWCAYSDPALVAAFAKYTAMGGATATAVEWYYQALFGDYAVLNNTFYAQDGMQFLPILDADLGPQKISYTDTKSIDVGSWSTKISREPNGYVYSNGPQEGWGLPGFDWIIDPDQDATVKRGVLSRDFSGGGLYWFNDQGLADRINDLGATEKLLLYVGSRAVYCYGDGSTTVVDADTDAAPTDATTEWKCTTVPGQGALHSPDERVYGSVNNDLERIEIFDIPNYESVVGLWAYLYLIPINEDGTIEGFDTGAESAVDHDFPILFRSGEISTNPTATPGEWKVSHNGITKALQAELPLEKFTAKLSGYQFSRSPFITSPFIFQQPHIGVIEVTGSPLGVVSSRVFLTPAPGTYVKYDTWDDLADAVVGAINDDATLGFTYVKQDGDIVVSYSDGDDDNSTFFYGPAAMALGVGYIRSDAIDAHVLDIDSSYSEHTMPGVGTTSSAQDLYFGIPGFEFPGFPKRLISVLHLAAELEGKDVHQHNISYEPVGGLTAVANNRKTIRNNSRCDYLIQWDWADTLYDYFGGWKYPFDGYGAWKVPADGDGDNFLYLSGESDATQLEDGDAISIGTPGNYAPVDAPGLSEASEYQPLERFMIGNVGATPVGSEYIELSETIAGSPSYAHLTTQQSNYSTAIRRGLSLYHAPAISETDQWELAGARSITGDEISELLRALLGDESSDADLPRRIPITTIPDVAESAIRRTLIDWVAWSVMDEEGTYNLKFDEKIKVLDLMNAYAFSHGYRLTYGYNESQRTWVLGLALIGSISTATVTAQGRDIGTDIIRRGEAPTDVIGSGWVYASVSVEAQRATDQPITVKAQKTVGRTAHIAGSKDLVVKDKISLFPDESPGVLNTGLIRQVEKYSRLFSAPDNQIRVPLTNQAHTQIVVGDGSTISWDALLKPSEGRRSGDTRVGIVVEATIRPDKTDILIRTGRKQSGIAPSLFLEYSNFSISGTTLTITDVSADTDDNLFADPDGGLTDLAMFGCLDYSTTSGSVVQRDCSCDPYRIWIFERGTDDLTSVGASRNVWTGKLEGTGSGDILTPTDVAAGEFVIELDDATNFSSVCVANSEFVVIFADRDDADLATCQLIYGWLGNSLSLVTDSDAATHRCISWG